MTLERELTVWTDDEHGARKNGGSGAAHQSHAARVGAGYVVEFGDGARPPTAGHITLCPGSA